MFKKTIAVLISCISFLVAAPHETIASSSRPKSLTCAKPDWNNPGPYDKKSKLNTAQQRAVDCSKELLKVTNRPGPCVCFAAFLMSQIGNGQFKVHSGTRNLDAGPRWNWIKANSEIQQKWNLSRPSMAPINPPYAIYWHGYDKSGHVAVYIGKNGDGKHIFIDNESAKRSPFWLEVGKNWPSNKVTWPVGASRVFFHPEAAPQNCLK